MRSARQLKKDEINFQAFCAAYATQGSLVFGVNCGLPYEWRKYILKWNAEFCRWIDQSRGGLITIYGKREHFVDEVMTWDRWCAFWNKQGFVIFQNPEMLEAGADFGLRPKSWVSKKPTRELCKQEKAAMAFMLKETAKAREMMQAVEKAEAEQVIDPEFPQPEKPRVIIGDDEGVLLDGLMERTHSSIEQLLHEGLPTEEAKDQQCQETSAQAHDEEPLPLVGSE